MLNLEHYNSFTPEELIEIIKSHDALLTFLIHHISRPMDLLANNHNYLGDESEEEAWQKKIKALGENCNMALNKAMKTLRSTQKDFKKYELCLFNKNVSNSFN